MTEQRKKEVSEMVQKLTVLEGKGAKFYYESSYVDSYFDFYPKEGEDENDLSTWVMSSQVFSDLELAKMHPGNIRVYLPCGSLDEIEDVDSIPQAPAIFED